MCEDGAVRGRDGEKSFQFVITVLRCAVLIVQQAYTDVVSERFPFIALLGDDTGIQLGDVPVNRLTRVLLTIAKCITSRTSGSALLKIGISRLPVEF